MKKNINNIDELNELAKEILAFSKKIKVLIFKGNLGTGKTSLIKHLCNIIGIQDQSSSPTYSIVNEYLLANNSKVYHIDLYRLNSLEEAYEVGLEDYLYSNNYCFIEWPEIIEEILPDEYITVSIEKISDKKRNFIIEKTICSDK